MIVIDKLCYQSKLRYENAGEKFAFAVITLCICVMSRSAAVAGIVLAATGILTVFLWWGPCFSLSEVPYCPTGLFTFKHCGYYTEYPENSSGSVRHSCGNMVSYLQSGFLPVCPAADPYCTCSGFLPVLSFLYHSGTGYPGCVKETALSQNTDRAYASDLSFYFCSAGNCQRDFHVSGLQAWK